MLRCVSSEQIEGLLTGQGDPLELELLEAHLNACPRCRQAFIDLTEISDLPQWRAAAQPAATATPDERAFLEQLKHPPAPPHPGGEGRAGKAVDASDWLGATNGHRGAPARVPKAVHVPFPQVSGFEILGELGRGGMGVVYKARQVAHDRIVALKMIQAGRHASPEDLGRFEDEGMAITRLRHPHIVQMIDVGQADGRLYFVLEFVEGGNLAEKIGRAPQHPRSSAQLLEALARAMHYAHQQQIVHRDLKPANVLLHGRKAFFDIPSEAGQRPTDWDFRRFMPKITDFGLAKLVDRSGQGHTASGDVVGTPSYMAPEQAQGKPYAVGATTDVYSLGAILYEMLTGKPPFLGPTPMDTLFQVHTQEPLPPRKVVRDVPPSLETICLKCLQKDPRKRYQTADDLAEDLRLFVEGQPIQARASHPFQAGWRSLRRTTGTLLFAMMALLTAAVAGGVMVYLGWQRERGAARTEVVTIEARSARREATDARLRQALDDCERGHAGRGTAALVDLLGDIEPLPDLRDYRDAVRSNLAHWGRTVPVLKLTLPDPARAATLSADGRVVLTAGNNLMVARLDATDGRPDGESWLMSGGVDSLLASADGTRAVARAGSRARWVVWPGDTQAKVAVDAGEVSVPAALSPDGRRLFTVRSGKPVIVEDVAGVAHASPLALRVGSTCAAWSPNGEAVLVGTSDGRAVTLTRSPTGWTEGQSFKQRSALTAVAWARGGTIAVLAGTDGQVALWGVTDGGLIAAFPAHPPGPVALAGSNDGRFVLTGGADRQAKLWRIESGTLTAALPHSEGVKAVALADTGAFLTLDGTGIVRVWELPDRAIPNTFGGGLEPLSRPALSADGKTVYATMGTETTARVARWSVAKGDAAQVTFRELGQFESVRPLAVGPGGKAVVLAQTPKGREVWVADVETRQALHLLPHDGEVKTALFRPDGPEVLTWDGRRVFLWNAETGARIGSPIPFAGQPGAFAIRPDGKALILGGEGTEKPGLARVWSLEEKGDRLSPPLHHAEPVADVVFEAGGAVVRTRDARHVTVRWEVATGQRLSPPLPDNAPLVAITPGGDRPVALGPDGTLKLYVGGDRPFMVLSAPPPAEWRCASFSDDGHTLLTGWSDGVRLWDARTGTPLGPLLPFARLDGAAFAGADGRRVLAWTGTEARLWRLPKPAMDRAGDWRVWLAARTGLARDLDGWVRLLDERAWKQRRIEFETKRLPADGGP